MALFSLPTILAKALRPVFLTVPLVYMGLTLMRNIPKTASRIKMPKFIVDYKLQGAVNKTGAITEFISVFKKKSADHLTS